MFELNKTLAGILLGGTLISIVGAVSTQYAEKKKPSAKSIVRDFLIGAVLVALVFQLLPESSTQMMTGLQSMIPSMSGGFLSNVEIDDLEVKVGVPRF